jgi:biopolymer transport protein ExbB/TolQ
MDALYAALYAALRFFQLGGMFMYPIAAILAIGLAIIIERYVYLTIVGASNRRTWRRLLPLVEEGKYDVAWELVVRSNTAISKILGYGLQRARSRGNGEEVQLAMEEGVLEYLPRLEKRTHYLATFANIATLLGLLGTIMGLIEAFSAVADAAPADKANLLSASISVAMNTTAFGLMVAIPLLLAHAYMQTKTSRVVESLEMATVKLANLMSVAATRAGTGA